MVSTSANHALHTTRAVFVCIFGHKNEQRTVKFFVNSLGWEVISPMTTFDLFKVLY